MIRSLAEAQLEKRACLQLVRMADLALHDRRGTKTRAVVVASRKCAVGVMATPDAIDVTLGA